VNDVPVEVWYPARAGSTAKLKTAPYDVRAALPEAERTKIPDDVAATFDAGAFRDVAIAENKRWPVVLFSHGFAGYRQQSSFLTAHIASFGYVVAASEHADRNLAAVLEGRMEQSNRDLMIAALDALASGDQNDAFFSAVDASRAVAIGHSAGSLSVSAAASDPRVLGWATYAGFSAPKDADKPGLVMGGTSDMIAQPEIVQSSFDAAPQTDKTFVMIRRAGHLAFSDICEIGKDNGGLLALAQSYGIAVSDLLLALGSDGCRDTDLNAKEAWPIIRHYSLAHIERVLGARKLSASEDADAKTCFTDRISRIR
jgi:predicted dienelactone hydrolase